MFATVIDFATTYSESTCSSENLQWDSKELLLNLQVRLSKSVLQGLLHLPLYLALLQKCHRTELGSMSEASNHLLDSLLGDALGPGLHPLACIIEQNMYVKVDV